MQQFAGDANTISHVCRSRRTRDPSGRRQVPNSCGKCGRRYAPTERCPAEGSTCKACGKLNHRQRYAVRLLVGRPVLNEDNNHLDVIDLEQGQVLELTEMSANEEEFIP